MKSIPAIYPTITENTENVFVKCAPTVYDVVYVVAMQLWIPALLICSMTQHNIINNFSRWKTFWNIQLVLVM